MQGNKDRQKVKTEGDERGREREEGKDRGNQPLTNLNLREPQDRFRIYIVSPQFPSLGFGVWVREAERLSTPIRIQNVLVPVCEWPSLMLAALEGRRRAVLHAASQVLPCAACFARVSALSLTGTPFCPEIHLTVNWGFAVCGNQLGNFCHYTPCWARCVGLNSERRYGYPSRWPILPRRNLLPVSI